MYDGEIIDTFVVFEGVDGSGKSSLINSLSKKIKEDGMQVHVTCEPGKTTSGKMIEGLLSQKTATLSIDDPLFAYLYAADRYEHVYGTDGILAHTKNKELVLCDRYFFSSYVYQGSERIKDLTVSLNRNFPLPKILVFLKIDTEKALERVGKRGKIEHSIVENSTVLQRVQQGYEQVLHELQSTTDVQCIILDAERSPEELTQKTLDMMYKHLGKTADIRR